MALKPTCCKVAEAEGGKRSRAVETLQKVANPEDLT